MIPVVFQKYPNTDTYTFPKFITTRNSKKYEIIEQITQGGNSVILKVRYGEEEYALKCDVLNNSMEEEIEILQELSADEGKQYFISYIDSGTLHTIEKRNKRKAVVSPSATFNYYIMDLAKNSMRDYLCKYEDRTFDSLLPQVKQLITGLKIIHDKGKLHRDLKPDNILMQGTALKIADFGLAISSLKQCSSRQGPKFWPNPEYLSFCEKKQVCSTQATDVFQLGCIIFYLFTSCYPIGTVTLDLINDDNPIKKLLEGMLAYDKTKRFSNGGEAWTALGKLIKK